MELYQTSLKSQDGHIVQYDINASNEQEAYALAMQKISTNRIICNNYSPHKVVIIKDVLHTNNILGFKVLEPSYNIVFNNEQGEVGRLEFDSNKLVFRGNIEESSEKFVEYLLKLFNSKVDAIVKATVEEDYRA